MVTFFAAIIALIVGYLFYGRLVEKIFDADSKRETPAITKADSVDYVALPAWRIFLIQFLNIAGLGPIFGAILGIFYGPAAFLWIVLGSIFAGGVHDYLSGMISLRKGGLSLPEMVGEELGSGARYFMRILSIVLLVLLTTSFMTSPALLISKLCAGGSIEFFQSPMVWLVIIFVYYALATVLPIDKIIGRFYPVFGAMLLMMGIGIAAMMLYADWQGQIHMLELSDGLHNRQPADLPLFPMMFVSIACGAISGFHGTQSPLMARCTTNERQGRHIFYGAMITEGILALIWAAAAGSFQFPDEAGNACLTIQEFKAIHPKENIAALVVNEISQSWLGKVGGIIAVIGVISASITSGDTALRSARLIIADILHLEQRAIWKRLSISLPLFVIVFGMSFVDFNIVWRYFSWTNQTLACFTLWMATCWLYKQEHGTTDLSHTHHPLGYLISFFPALFMTMVSVSYILIAPEGFHLPVDCHWIAYTIGLLTVVTLAVLFLCWTRKMARK
ncbi:MAG: carbon starvation protein A [Paludibacteraceae bacterium]|nr:carbon starvation protein A [Paludibacteraceae bacterium]